MNEDDLEKCIVYISYQTGCTKDEVREAIQRMLMVSEELDRRMSECALRLSELFDTVGIMIENRPPEVIKKELKYEKNPMRIKQLNKELNEAYRNIRRKDVTFKD